jgi:hypothetical protein
MSYFQALFKTNILITKNSTLYNLVFCGGALLVIGDYIGRGYFVMKLWLV